MVVFDGSANLHDDVGFQLMWNTPVTLYWRQELLGEATAWLDHHGYQVTTFDAGAWQVEADMLAAVAEGLDFPDYFGRNLDALNDCLRDVVTHDYGWSPTATGRVLAFVGYDRFAAACPHVAQVLLDILTVQARSALLFGDRLICLVQSDDPDIAFEPVGAVPVLWNNAEWLHAKRHPNR